PAAPLARTVGGDLLHPGCAHPIMCSFLAYSTQKWLLDRTHVDKRIAGTGSAGLRLTWKATTE
uniref:Uncharacterized protein n=1 Tax=Oryza brachyantha TaxID=4533 RepID=J3L4W5_ORYBR